MKGGRKRLMVIEEDKRCKCDRKREREKDNEKTQD